jgi:hypothetical protein
VAYKDGAKDAATFMWSRDNGCVVYAIRQLEVDDDNHRARVSLDSLGRDAGQTLEADHWVELVDGREEPARLFRVAKVYPEDLSVDLEVPDGVKIPDASTRAYLRRWDHAGDPDSEGAIRVVEGQAIPIENGIEITFVRGNPAATYQSGDYWLIPARKATGDIEWPMSEGTPPTALAQPPRGEEHHFAPLAVIDPTKNGSARVVGSLRRSLP